MEQYGNEFPLSLFRLVQSCPVSRERIEVEGRDGGGEGRDFLTGQLRAVIDLHPKAKEIKPTFTDSLPLTSSAAYQC